MSISHLLILLFDFIFSKTDNSTKEPTAIITLLLDMSKGFTLVNHNKILTRLSDWNVPGWLLRIVSSYLTDRKMTVRFRGASSSIHSLPSGCAQGDVVGMILFLVQMSDLGMPPVQYAGTQAGDTLAVPAPPPPAVTPEEVRLKWVDDTSLAECVRLDKVLEKEESVLTGPRNFHDRHGWILSQNNSKLQKRIKESKFMLIIWT